MSYLKEGNTNNASVSSLSYSTYNDVETASHYPQIPMAGNPSSAGLSTMAPPMPIRTPSPTPSDIEELKKGAIDWHHILNWRNWVKREYIWYYVAIAIFAIIAALLSIFHKQLIDWLTPGAQYLRHLHGGWSIPIGVMFVLSFPPLFGNEIVHVLCGIVWGLWIGFGIVCAGTFLGEIGNFYAFRYCCQSRGNKLERTSIPYACLARCVREGGFLVAVIARLSAIPGHFTTAVFSTCGMSIWTFCLGAFLSLPKQFATVYIGVVIDNASGQETTGQKVISGVVLTISIGITIFAAWWILQRMQRAKPAVLAERRKRRAMELYGQKTYAVSGQSGFAPLVGSTSSNSFQTPTASSSMSTITPYDATGKPSNFNQPFNYSGGPVDLPLSVKPQRWDAHGRAILENQYDRDANLYPPQQGQYRPDLQSQRQPSPLSQGVTTAQTGRSPPPNIMITRASGMSTVGPPAAIAQGRQGSYDDVSLFTPTQTASGQSGPSHQGPIRPQPQRRETDESSNESAGPAWAAGTTREDEDERDPSLYNPYDAPPPGGHTWEPTDASVASYHTAQGSNGFELVDYPAGSGHSTPNSRQQQQQQPPQGRV